MLLLRGRLGDGADRLRGVPAGLLPAAAGVDGLAAVVAAGAAAAPGIAPQAARFSGRGWPSGIRTRSLARPAGVFISAFRTESVQAA